MYEQTRSYYKAYRLALLTVAVAGAMSVLALVSVMGAAPAAAQSSSPQSFPDQQLESPDGGFGGGLDSDEDTALVGSSVYTFDGVNWQLTVQLTPPSLPEPTSEGDFALRDFAGSTAISGDTAVVTGSFVIPISQGGVAEARPFFAVYERNDSSGDGAWDLQEVVEVDGVQELSFGATPNDIDDVDISGNTVVVGDSDTDGANTRSGVAFIYTRSGESFVQSARLAPEEVGRFGEFGSDVAIDGSTIVVGDESDRSGTSSSGAAYVFEGSSLVKKLTAPQPTFLAEFGKSLTIEDDTIAVGSGAGEGEVFLFGRDTGGASQWGLDHQLVTPDKTDSLGATDFDVAISGERVILGTTGLDSDGQLAPGTVYQFDRSAGQDTPVARLVLESDNGSPRFGVPVALSRDQALVAALNLGNRGGVLAYTLE